MLRHHQNKNLLIHYGSDYCGLPIQCEKGPFFQQYLEGLRGVIDFPLESLSQKTVARIR
jgi:hypothetical protein